MPVYAITGANRGLGLEFVRQLLSDSSNTVIGAVRSTNNDLSELKALDKDGRLHILECDTSSTSSISKFGEGVTKILGQDRQLHYLLNNAGINGVPDQTSLDLTETDLQKHISVNVFGPAKTVQVVLPHIQKGTVIVNMVRSTPSGFSPANVFHPRLRASAVSKKAPSSRSAQPTVSVKLL
jgi:NAD(P)-dependent dehydrogenase (short-subunit alcohol dehydrogenase family)